VWSYTSLPLTSSYIVLQHKNLKKHISAKDILTKKWGLILDSSVTSIFIKGAATALTKQHTHIVNSHRATKVF